jgi:hypothetical protein
MHYLGGLFKIVAVALYKKTEGASKALALLDEKWKQFIACKRAEKVSDLALLLNTSDIYYQKASKTDRKPAT